MEECTDVHKCVAKEGWPTTWFYIASIGEKPWFIYLSDGFVGQCLTNRLLEQVWHRANSLTLNNGND
ncbi:hypothetical protein Rcae01_04678 [Novipirellula caenicola]|uniref:Uncharacterized protein n=1 Tax=Novipirellula caenicola TaxID=1536901 RepID=A0ABP9VY29_9BACT